MLEGIFVDDIIETLYYAQAFMHRLDYLGAYQHSIGKESTIHSKMASELQRFFYEYINSQINDVTIFSCSFYRVSMRM